MARLRQNLTKGELGQSITPTDTTLTFLGGAPDLPAISSPDYMVVTLGDVEVVHITDFTPGNSTATIVRGREGSTAVSHSTGDNWEHGPTELDFDEPTIRNTIDTIGATGATHDISFGVSYHDLTMDQDCVFGFTGADAGRACSTTALIRGAFSPTFGGGATVLWPNATPATYSTPSLYTFLTTDGGTTVLAFLAGAGLG